jgi:hypothetical protein
MAPYYLPLVTKNDIVVNAICDYVLHDYKTSSRAKVLISNIIIIYFDQYLAITW